MNTMHKCILVPIDRDHERSWQSLLSATTDLAQRHHAQLEIAAIAQNTGVSTIKNYFSNVMNSRLCKEGINQLNQFIAGYFSKNISVQSQEGRGRIYSKTLPIASKLITGLIITAIYTFSVSNYLIRVNTKKVMRHIQYSVMVMCKKWRKKHHE